MAHTVPVGQKWWSGGKSPFNVEYGKLMMWYFLMSDAFTFGAFLISYGTIRFSSSSWPNPNEVFKSFPLYRGDDGAPGIREPDDFYPDHEFGYHGNGGRRRTDARPQSGDEMDVLHHPGRTCFS